MERGLQKHEANIPKDYGVIGFDGVFLDQIAYPRLTTIKQSVVEMGASCATMLLNKINQKGALKEINYSNLN